MGDTPISRPNTAGITAESATWVILDDTSDDIEYVGNWDSITASSQINNIGYFGPTFRNTLHRLTGRGSLTYQFQGTAVRVSGTIINKLGDPLTKTDCYVDGVKHKMLILDNFEANNFEYCDILDLNDGQHTLNVTFSVPSGHTAWIDKLAYIPSPSADLSNALLQVDDADPMIKYDSYWQDMTLARWTHSNGSQAIIDFAGTSLVWYSLSYPSQDGVRPESQAIWTIDDDPEEHTIIVPARRPSDPDPHYNEVILNITNLTPSRHRLKVIRRSDSNAEPLYLDYLQIGMVPVPDLPSTTSSSTPGASSTSSSGNNDISFDDGSSSLSTGAEIGIGIGAAVAVILLAFLTLFLYRRYKRDYQQDDNVSILSRLPMSTVDNHSSSGNIASASLMSASTHLVSSHPSGTTGARPPNKAVISVDPHNLLTNGHRYDENDEGEPQSPGLTEDPPRYSMHFAQGTTIQGP